MESDLRESQPPVKQRSHAWLWLVFFAFAFSAIAHAQPSANWRIFRANDGLADSFSSAVYVSPHTNIWVKHYDGDAISVLDGYSISKLQSPGKNYFRIYESRSGQLWSLATNGLVVYDDLAKHWVAHPVAEIRAENQDPLRQFRQIPLVPADRDHVLFLLGNSLVEYDCELRRSRLLRSADQTRLGRFNEMTEGRDGNSIWISGTRGLARIGKPARQITASTRWEEFLIPEALGIQKLQRPFEGTGGRITVLAEKTAAPTERVIVQFDGQNWKTRPVPSDLLRRKLGPISGELIRQAWEGWDNVIWGHTFNSLVRFEEEKAFRENIWVGQYKDVAREPNGVFWLATSEGVVRYAPFLWRPPAGAVEIGTVVHAIFEEPEGVLWFATSEFLLQFRNGQWKRFRWPENYETELRSTDSLFRLKDGKIAISGPTPLIFDPAAERFEPFPKLRGVQAHILGSMGNRSVCLELISAGGKRRLENFDGRTFSAECDVEPEWELGELAFSLLSARGELWLGGTGGLGVYRDKHFQKFGPANRFLMERPISLLETADGKFWCGGENRILEYDGKKWTLVLSGTERVNALVKTREGKICVATGAGILYFSKGSWVAQGPEEGLSGSAVYDVFEDGSGRLWAGTTQGIFLLHPDADLDPPRVLAPELEKSSANLGVVTLRCRGLDKWDQTSPERLLYSWKIDEGAWSPFTNSIVQRFTQLGAGEHRFVVRAMDRNWNESDESAPVEFSILVPWYKERRLVITSIFGGGLILLFAAVAINRHRRLVRSYAEVGRMVALRTQELEKANQELLHSQKMKALGTLAAGIAHDFNNILSIIKGSAQIIETHLEDKEKIRTRVNRIQTVVEQGTAIVRAMLGLSRVMPSDLQPCSLNGVVEETLKLLGDRLPRELAVRFEPAANVPPLLCSKEILQQMLVNLILNAVDATAQQGEVNLKTGQWVLPLSDVVLAPAQGERYFYVSVQDTGLGISPEVLPRIFEPFFTTKAFSTRRGTGLGLSMVYELAKQMGYGLAVESKPGSGSAFSILISQPHPSDSQNVPPKRLKRRKKATH